MDLEQGLIGHWPLQEDARDAAAGALITTPHRVRFGVPGPSALLCAAACFDGCGAQIEVAAAAALRLGTGDFTAMAWIRVESTTDIIGDIISQFDPQGRRGFSMAVVSHPGVTTSMANDRNLHFGMDSGVLDSAWTDCGQPGKAVFVFALAVFRGDLYAATCEPDADRSGHVHRYSGGAEWEDCGSPAPCNSVSSLVVHDGALYCGVSRYKLAGSCLPASPNQHPGGAVYRYDGGRGWTLCGQLDEGNGVHCMCSFGGRLYATPTYDHQVFEYQGGTTWKPVGPDARVMSMGFWNGSLYALTSGADSVYRYGGAGAWTDCGRPPGTSQLYSFLVYQGRPHVGTWPRGEVFRYDGEQTWTLCGSPGYSKEIMGMALYNGKVYAGTLPMADVYRYEGESRWRYTGDLDRSHGYQLRRAWSMSVHGGRLYCGTLPSGAVYSLAAGQLATWDHRLENGWHHVAGVRRAGTAELWLDGSRVAVSPRRTEGDLDLTQDLPLLIGGGQHDTFCGDMASVSGATSSYRSFTFIPLPPTKRVIRS